MSIVPFVFALFIVQLAVSFRKNGNINGFQTTSVEHKRNSLYADDIVLYLYFIISLNQIALFINLMKPQPHEYF